MSDNQPPSQGKGTRTHSRGRSGTVAGTGALTGPAAPHTGTAVPNESNSYTGAVKNSAAVTAPTSIAPSASPGMLLPPTGSPIEHERLRLVGAALPFKDRGKFSRGLANAHPGGAPGPGHELQRAQRIAADSSSARPMGGDAYVDRATYEEQRPRETKKGPRAWVCQCINFIC